MKYDEFKIEKLNISISFLSKKIINIKRTNNGGARGVMVIVVRNGHGNTSSNPGRD